MPYRVSGCFKVPLIKPFMSRIADNVVINARRAAKMVPATRYREAAACVRKKYVVGPRLHPLRNQPPAGPAGIGWLRRTLSGLRQLLPRTPCIPFCKIECAAMRGLIRGSLMFGMQI